MYKNFKKYYRGWRKYLFDFVLIVIIFVAVRGYQNQTVLSGQAVPIEGVLLDKSPIQWERYQGKPMLIHFWASWCRICRIEEDSIQSISEDYAVLSIASWSEDTLSYMRQQGLSFPTLDDVNGKWAETYGIKAVPASFIVNSEGQIKFIESGYSSEVGLRLRLWWLGI
ncbi:MAG: redoxin domain-containing protein [Gammaproteobacteria bacterium]|nr:redoxin domain-containing protein [Gammaproteobacteria bacterium]